MSDVKWIKIVTDIFDDEKMYAIETLPDGLTLEVVWFKVLCLAGKCNSNGFLTINNKIAYTDEMLAKIFRMDIGVVQRALEVFQKLDMIETVENAYMVSNWLKYQSGDKLEDIRAKGRERQKNFRNRQKQKQLQENNVTCNVTVTQNCSYSYSNNLNLNNLIYILNNNIFKDSDYIKDNSSLYTSIKEWMNYKDNKKPTDKNHYDTELGICKLLSRVVKTARAEGIETVIDSIDESIGNNYQGIVWKINKNKQSKSSLDDWV